MESMQWKHKTSPTAKKAVTTWFAEKSKDFFFMGIKSLQQKWAKYIELLGEYIAK
jgi:hypothetical protein